MHQKLDEFASATMTFIRSVTRLRLLVHTRARAGVTLLRLTRRLLASHVSNQSGERGRGFRIPTARVVTGRAASARSVRC